MLKEQINLSDAYIERCDKETENVLGEESAAFLDNPIDYLKKQKHEFIYLESDSFETIGVDAVSFEVDDVFGTYGVLLGLKLQKKFETALKEYMNKELHGEDAKFSLLFNQNDGLWDVNFALNNVDGFKEQMSMGEAFGLIYQFLFSLIEAVKVNR